MTDHTVSGASMTAAQARAVLGPDVCAVIDARPVTPLTDEQIARLVPILLAVDDRRADTTAADAA